MAQLVLYHLTPNRSSRVLWAYLELRKAYEAAGKSGAVPPLRLMEFPDPAAFRRSKPDWYLQIHPNGKVPVLIDRKHCVSMFDSCAIISYLLDTYDVDGLLLPKEPQASALFHQVAFYCSGTVDNFVATSSPIQRTKLLNAKRGLASSLTETEPQYMNPDTRRAWDSIAGPFFESLLAKSGGPFLLGSSFTAADVIFGYCLKGLGDKMREVTGASWLDPGKTPLLTGFKELLEQRPARRLAFSRALDWEEALHGVAVEAARAIE